MGKYGRVKKKERQARAEAQRGKPQPKMNWPQKNAKAHKENNHSKFLSMRSLHCNPSESRIVARIFFPRRERRERREKTGKRVRHAVRLRDLCASACTFSFRQGLGLGLRAVPGRGRLVLEQDVLNRRKQREQSVTGHGPSLRFLCCLLFTSGFGCGWPRCVLRALREKSPSGKLKFGGKSGEALKIF